MRLKQEGALFQKLFEQSVCDFKGIMMPNMHTYYYVKGRELLDNLKIYVKRRRP